MKTFEQFINENSNHIITPEFKSDIDQIKELVTNEPYNMKWLFNLDNLHINSAPTSIKMAERELKLPPNEDSSHINKTISAGGVISVDKHNKLILYNSSLYCNTIISDVLPFETYVNIIKTNTPSSLFGDITCDIDHIRREFFKELMIIYNKYESGGYDNILILIFDILKLSKKRNKSYSYGNTINKIISLLKNKYDKKSMDIDDWMEIL